MRQRAAYTEAKEVKEEEDTLYSDSESETDDEDGNGSVAEESHLLTVQSLLKNYREAFSVDDKAALTEIESRFQSVEEERTILAKQVSSLTEDISQGKERFLRLNADFENFRKRSERDRLAVSTNVKGDVVSSLLPMVDNFERAKTQIKIETEGEKKIDDSYQGIYKQFVEIMKGLGVSVVETVGKEFDPNIHEAIMREESSQYAEGIVVEEFRRGFILGEKLLRPAMVKVSAGLVAPAAPEPTVHNGDVPEAENNEAD